MNGTYHRFDVFRHSFIFFLNFFDIVRTVHKARPTLSVEQTDFIDEIMGMFYFTHIVIGVAFPFLISIFQFILLFGHFIDFQVYFPKRVNKLI